MSRLFLVSIFVLFISIPVTVWGSFSDISNESPYSKSVEVFSAEDIIEGYNDGTFKPDNEIIRAEALKVILLALPDQSSELADNTFSDVFADQWFHDYVREAVKRGIVNGYNDGTFKPAQPVNMAEALKMALFAKGIDESSMSFIDFHPEVKSDDWYAKYMSYGFEHNLFDIGLDGGLQPTAPITRGEFVDMVYRVRSFNPNAEFDISYNWKTDVSTSGLEVQVPYYWDFYQLDSAFFLGFFDEGRPDFIHLKPNNVKVAFTYWSNPNGLTATEYFKELKSKYEEDYGDYEVVVTENVATDGPAIMFEVAEKNVVDHYVYLEDGRLLAGHGIYDGESLKAPDFVDEIKKVFELANFASENNLLENSQKLSQVRENILVNGKGQELINLFEDYIIIETDTLGVGTGPIDYYYVRDIDYTFKYERSSDVILDIQEGRTSAF